MTSPGLTGMTELPSGTSAACAGMVTRESSGISLSSASISVMILVVLAGYIRTLEFLENSTSPESSSTRSTDWANRCSTERFWGLFLSYSARP